MNRAGFVPFATLALGAMLALGAAPDPMAGYWPKAKVEAILAKTEVVRLAPDLTSLSAEESRAARHLIEAGGILHEIYERSNHRQANTAAAALVALDRKSRTAHTRGLVDLHRLFRGAYATTLDNQRETFLPVEPFDPGKNVYPPGVTKDEIERFLATHPERRAELLHPRTVVRRAVAASLRADLATLARHPGLALLNPELEHELEWLQRHPSRDAFYAVPYAVAYADDLMKVYQLLYSAAGLLEPSDPEFAGYLRQRARDLLSNDYEAGDAAWVTGTFGRLNAQIGAYEVYDDELYGVKAFHSLSLLLRDSVESAKLRSATADLQAFENSLPIAVHKRVRSEIPIGIYDVIADFGEARGTNTATILPNESRVVRRYGRTILIRRNIIAHPQTVENARRTWVSAVVDKHHADFHPEGAFHRTLWHEIGHYLGPDRDSTDRELDLALEEESGTFEEMKADLVSLYLVRALRQKKVHDDRSMRGVYASGIARMLQKSRPRRDQVYQTMQLMQMNWFLDKSALSFDPASGALAIRYDRYHQAVASLLREVLAIQYAGDKQRAARFIDRWTAWDDRHERLAAAIRAAEQSRFRLVRYAALGE